MKPGVHSSAQGLNERLTTLPRWPHQTKNAQKGLGGFHDSSSEMTMTSYADVI
jgi:hypothetical protein